MAATYLKLVLAFVFVATATCNENTDNLVGNLSLEKRVKLMETLLDQQMITNQKLEARVGHLERRVEDLEESNLRMRGNTSRDEANMTESGIETVNVTLDNLTSEDDYMANLECQERCFGSKPHKNEMYGNQGSRVAFHAYQRGNHCYGNKEIIRYDVEDMDFGEGYTPYDGIFDAPSPGVYVFTWTVASSITQGWFVAQLVIDGEVKGAITSDSDATTNIQGGIHPATGVVTTYVDKGQHVFIKMMQVIGECVTVKSDVLVRSTFSGWKLF